MDEFYLTFIIQKGFLRFCIKKKNSIQFYLKETVYNFIYVQTYLKFYNFK